MPKDIGFTSAVFGCFQLQIRHGAPLPVCPVSASLLLAPSRAEEPPQARRKPSTQEITSRPGCAGAGSSQVPLHHRSGGHSGCKARIAAQHRRYRPGTAALTVGDSCSEDTKTQLSSSRGCAHLALPPSRCLLPLGTLRKPSRGTPSSPR